MKHWVPVWHQAITENALSKRGSDKEKTVTFTIRIPFACTRIRMRFSNRYGTNPYDIKGVSVIHNNTIHYVSSQGSSVFEVPMNTVMTSDETDAVTDGLCDLTVRICYSGLITDGNSIEEYADLQDGNLTDVLPESGEIHKPLFLKLLGISNIVPALEMIEAETETDASCVVAFGYSITAMSRWTKPLSRRLEDAYHGKYVLLNSGISGNCLLYRRDGAMGKLFGREGINRFEDDVLNIPNVSTVIFALGVNDVSYITEETKGTINTDAFIKAVTDIVSQLHERNIRVAVQTITPRLKCARSMGKFTQEMENVRLEWNEWIRTAGIFDYVVDQEKAVKARDLQGLYFKEGLHQGDHLHPNEEGGRIMAQNYDLKQLTGE